MFCLVVLYLGFEKWEDRVVLDESDKGNNAYLNNGAFIAEHKGMCGHFASLGKSGDILLEDTTFRGKPRSGITVASWVNLARTSRGIHSLFSTARVMTIGQVMGKNGFYLSLNEMFSGREVYMFCTNTDNVVSLSQFEASALRPCLIFLAIHSIGGYHFEIDDGKVRWFHRNRFQTPVFSVITDDIIKPDVWTHLIGSYNSTTQEAKVDKFNSLLGLFYRDRIRGGEKKCQCGRKCWTNGEQSVRCNSTTGVRITYQSVTGV